MQIKAERVLDDEGCPIIDFTVTIPAKTIEFSVYPADAAADAVSELEDQIEYVNTLTDAQETELSDIAQSLANEIQAEGPVTSESERIFERMAELSSILNVEIVSYGLAPNPMGYCYEVSDDGPSIDDQDYKDNWRELDDLCDTAPEGFFEHEPYNQKQ